MPGNHAILRELMPPPLARIHVSHPRGRPLPLPDHPRTAGTFDRGYSPSHGHPAARVAETRMESEGSAARHCAKTRTALK